MKNLYYLITLGTGNKNLKEMKKRGLPTKGLLPHQKLHWRLSVDKKQAIIQGDFTDGEQAWMRVQPWATKLGKYTKGRAEKSVHDYIKVNKVKWEKQMII